MLHPHPRLQTTWNFARLGLLLLPLLPLLGAVSLFAALVITWRQRYRQISRRPLNWCLALITIWLIITASLGVHRSEAVLGLANFLPFFGLFAAYSELIQTPAQLQRLARIIVISSVPVVIIGFGQLFFGWVSPIAWQGVLGWVIAPGGNPPGRMASVFMYTNVLAGYLVIAFILGVGLWLAALMEAKVNQPHPASRHSLVRARHKPLTTYSQLMPRLLLTVAVLGNLVALILTNSRNAWAIAVLAGLAFAIYQGWRWLVAGVVAITSSVFLAAFGPLPLQTWLRQLVPAFFWARLTDQLYPDRPVVLLRQTQWQFAWDLTQQRPWQGWGLRNFTPLYLEKMQVWLGHPHNFLLMLTAEIGIPGAVLFCSWVGWILVQGFQVLRSWSVGSVTQQRHSAAEQVIFFSYLVAGVACILFNTVDVTLFDLRLNTLGWLLLSAICGIVHTQRPIQHS